MDAMGVDGEIVKRPPSGAGKLPSTGGFSKEPGQTCHFSNRCAERASETVMICSFNEKSHLSQQPIFYVKKLPDSFIYTAFHNFIPN
jgi:hypothetical protein